MQLEFLQTVAAVCGTGVGIEHIAIESLRSVTNSEFSPLSVYTWHYPFTDDPSPACSCSGLLKAEHASSQAGADWNWIYSPRYTAAIEYDWGSLVSFRYCHPYCFSSLIRVSDLPDNAEIIVQQQPARVVGAMWTATTQTDVLPLLTYSRSTCSYLLAAATLLIAGQYAENLASVESFSAAPILLFSPSASSRLFGCAAAATLHFNFSSIHMKCFWHDTYTRLYQFQWRTREDGLTIQSHWNSRRWQWVMRNHIFLTVLSLLC